MKKFLLTFFIALNFFSFARAAEGNFPFLETNDRVLVKFYPNPAVSIINFEFKELDRGSTLQIFSLVGKKVFEVSSLSPITKVPLNDFFRGVYIFQLRDKSGQLIESGKFQVAK